METQMIRGRLFMESKPYLLLHTDCSDWYHAWLTTVWLTKEALDSLKDYWPTRIRFFKYHRFMSKELLLDPGWNFKLRII